MRKTTIFLIVMVLCLLLQTIVSMAQGEQAVELRAGVVQEPLPLPFKDGEKLTYDVRYKGAKVGKSILTFHGEHDLAGRKVYHISFSTRIPSLKDTEELYADKETFLPIEVHRNIKKTMGFNDRIVEKYDQENFRVDIESKSRLRTKTFSIEKDSEIHNAILLAYYCRVKEDFNKGDRFKITLPTLDFEVIFTGLETIETKLGEYRAYAFTSEPPKFNLWLSADENRIPLKIKHPGTFGYSLVIKSID